MTFSKLYSVEKKGFPGWRKILQNHFQVLAEGIVHKLNLFNNKHNAQTFVIIIILFYTLFSGFYKLFLYNPIYKLLNFKLSNLIFFLKL